MLLSGSSSIDQGTAYSTLSSFSGISDALLVLAGAAAFVMVVATIARYFLLPEQDKAKTAAMRVFRIILIYVAIVVIVRSGFDIAASFGSATVDPSDPQAAASYAASGALGGAIKAVTKLIGSLF